MSAYKTEQHKGTVADAVSGAFGDLQCLAEECREIVDNASEGLQQTQRIQTFESTADQLESLSEPDVPEDFGGTPVTWSQSINRRKGRGLSRARRCSDAVTMLQAVVDACDDYVNDLDDGDRARKDTDEIEALRDECQTAIDEAEGCEFPGMYG